MGTYWKCNTISKQQRLLHLFFILNSSSDCLWTENTNHWLCCESTAWEWKRTGSPGLFCFLCRNTEEPHTEHISSDAIYHALNRCHCLQDFCWTQMVHSLPLGWYHGSINLVNPGSGTGLVPGGTKPLPKPMLTCCQWGPFALIHMKVIFHEMLPTSLITCIIDWTFGLWMKELNYWYFLPNNWIKIIMKSCLQLQCTT